MHQNCSHHPYYTGAGVYPHAHHSHHAHAHHHHHHGHDLHGFCNSCCHPKAQCCCHRRECRKEAKELLVQPNLSADQQRKDPTFMAAKARAMFVERREVADRGTPDTGTDAEKAERGVNALNVSKEAASSGRLAAQPLSVLSSAATSQITGGVGRAFIGGGCCVHLSIEYAPSSPTALSLVAVLVDDVEDTVLAWAKLDQPGVGYQVKEGIISTKPGANLTVLVINATARVRWCEIFSC